MGFTPETTTYRLTFDGTDLDGLIVELESVSVGVMLDLLALADTAKDNPASTAKFFDTLGDALIEWNLEIPAGNPIPADRTGVRRLTAPHAMTLVKAWASAMQDVPAPLDQPSTGGSPSAVVSLPMEPLSANRAS